MSSAYPSTEEYKKKNRLLATKENLDSELMDKIIIPTEPYTFLSWSLTAVARSSASGKQASAHSGQLLVVPFQHP